jgi:hypothetical protein
LVHVEDIRIAPHLYSIIESRPAPPKVERQDLAPPDSLVPPEETFMVEDDNGRPPEPKRIDLDRLVRPPQAIPEQPDRQVAWLQEEEEIDWQKVPGVTARISQKLEGYDFDDILQMGIEGLQAIDYVGPARAKAIYNAVLEATKEAVSA